MKLKFLIVISLLSIIGACNPDDEPEYSPIPSLIFKEAVFNREDNNGLIEDSYNVVFEYIDGDGDIGMREDEEFLPNSDSIKHVLFVDYFEQNKNGVFVRNACALGSDTATKKYRLPIITPPGNNKAIRGEISVKVLPCPVPLDTTKVIRFEMYIYDRALNRSNTVRSEDIIYETQKQ